ncbi:hypothetical protein FS837_012976 [Tulasnella sp. UAMH 9824]|nr:hypothetical protein FS837_012976 [Tulasnella sp. UAMH 9824]
MDRQQKLPEFLTRFRIPRAEITPIFRHITPRFGTFFTAANGHARRIISRLPLLIFRDRPEPTWASEVRGRTGGEDWIVLVCARYPKWTTTTANGIEFPLELNAVMNDPKRILDAVGYVHGDKSRRLYFVADFDVSYKDRKGVTKFLPRATLPTTGEVALPNGEGIFAIFNEASKQGGSGLVHCGMHCFYEPSGTSNITKDGDGTIHLINTWDGSASYETFIVDIDGHRIYGKDFLACLPDMSERTNTTLTLSLDICNAAAFLAGVVNLPCLYPAPSSNRDYTELESEPRSYNQLVVISACQLRQFAGEAGECGAMTYLLTDKLMGSREATAAEVVRSMRERFQTHPDPSRRQLPQIASRYPLTGRFRLLPDSTSVRDHHANL